MPIRAIEPRDHTEWLRMRLALWPDCSEKLHRLEMSDALVSGAVIVFARDDASLGGFIELSIRNSVEGSASAAVAYIEGWYVDSDLRGQGIGRQLVETGERWALMSGCREIASDAELHNDRSIRAHKKLGFDETARLVHFLKPLSSEIQD
jgi:aminoglycoside 6'-N-acetyltransferase I